MITVQAKDQGAVKLVIDLAIVFQLCGLGRRVSIFLRKILRVLCGYFEHQRRVQFDRCVAEPLQTITATLPEFNAMKVLKSIKREAEEKDFKLSITEGGSERKSKVIASCSYLEEKFQECSKREEAGLATSVETLGVDLRRRTVQPGAKEKARRQKCDLKFSFARRSRVFQLNYMRIGVRKLLRMGLVFARVWERTSRWHCAL